METQNKVLRLLALSLFSLAILTSCSPYRKMNPPADADKPSLAGDNSCWLATAANMLAGAGYGDGSTLQERADDIYGDLTSNYGTANGGWTDVALSWWLSSSNNTWTSNPYTVVNVTGNKSPRNPWANPNGTQFYANELRRCCFVGLSISWPTAGTSVGSGGHAITAWGDTFGKSTLSVNPSNVFATDSDRDTGGDEQEYDYDTYTNPNPGGSNEGNGWYMDYSNNHPYVKHIITLCPSDNPEDKSLTQKVVGSYKITQDSNEPATDLHYTVSTDVEILSYKTTINHDTENPPVITESGSPRNQITVDWDLTENPVAKGKEITITTEFVLPSWNAMQYSDVYFTYSNDGKLNVPGSKFVDIYWNVETAEIENMKEMPSNVSGGFVIGSFDIIGVNENGEKTFSPYRFLHEYSFNQNPELHILELISKKDVFIENLKIGHSWNNNLYDDKWLWGFDNWMTTIDKNIKLGNEPIEFKIDWNGLLPYPEGENIFKAVPEKNGIQRHPNDKN